MKAKRMRPEVLREPRGAKIETSSCPSFVNSLPRPVNHLVLFRLAAVNGLGLAGGWADRLTLWLPALDQAAKLLREVAEGRI